MLQIIRSFFVLIFLLLLAFQGWRGFCFNSANIIKSLFQLVNLKHSEQLLAKKNQELILKIESMDIKN